MINRKKKNRTEKIIRPSFEPLKFLTPQDQLSQEVQDLECETTVKKGRIRLNLFFFLCTS